MCLKLLAEHSASRRKREYTTFTSATTLFCVNHLMICDRFFPPSAAPSNFGLFGLFRSIHRITPFLPGGKGIPNSHTFWLGLQNRKRMVFS